MAKQKPPKMKPAEAVKILANEMQQTKTMISQMLQDLTQLRGFAQEVAKVTECYILFKKDEIKFSEYMKNLVKKQKAAQVEKNIQVKKEQKNNDTVANGQTNVANIKGNKGDKRQRAEGVRA